MEDAESKKFLESSLCLMTPSHGNMAENSAFQKGNQCLFCVAESDYRKWAVGNNKPIAFDCK